MDEGKDEGAAELGEQVRDRRHARGLSLRELAERTGLTASFLSQVERGVTSPSIDSLRKISRALHVPIFHFLLEPEETSPVVRRKERIRVIWPGSEITWQLLTPNLHQKMEALLTEWEPGVERPVVNFGERTEEFVYVLQGQLEVTLGEQAYLLGPGDTIYFEGMMLRGLEPQGDVTVRFLSVITPPVF
jgi:transcriptional regulator with XRE-family HTH domain